MYTKENIACPLQQNQFHNYEYYSHETAVCSQEVLLPIIFSHSVCYAFTPLEHIMQENLQSLFS